MSSLPPVPVIVVALIFSALWVLGVHWGLRHVVKYRIASDGLEVVALRVIVLSRVRWRDISGIEVMTFGRVVKSSLLGDLFWAARAGNRLFCGRAVVIRKRSGVYRALIITPDEPDRFAERLRAQLSPELANVSMRRFVN